jgi:hypothetical protein
MAMGLLDSILGRFNSGESGGFLPGSMLNNAPSSGYLPEDQVSTPPTDPYGNPVGGPALGVPLPRPRPPEAGPAAFSPGLSPPDMQPGESGGVGDGSGGGLAAALGLNPETMRRISAGLAGGLSNVKNSPFAGQVAANAAGGAFAAGNKSDETAINQALKLQQISQRGGTRSNPARATMLGQGTREMPFVPASADHYAQIAPGAYWRAADGSLRIKGQPDNKVVMNGAR